MPLSGRVCVITGAGRGIGRHTAEAFARNGARLALCSRTKSELDEVAATLGTEVFTAHVDVADPSEVASFAESVQARFGRADVLVNCAGVQGPVGPITEVDPIAWVRALQVNLLGVVHAVRAFVPLLRGATGPSGSIITMSGGGLGGSSVAPRLSAYTASKAAVLSITETLAKELAPDRIRINALAPGAINTSFVDAVLDAGPEVAGPALYEATVRQRHAGDSIEKVGEAMLFLASDASSGLTGKLISAKWDPLGELVARTTDDQDLFTLRRIDDVLFSRVSTR
ncbi:MAG TPA: SDR family oxidoreductase [Actinomycetota bacterium]|nr:SDR family oxidoreductase [Actinomycetota bacterium]